jgi:hypothetical protein
MRVAANVHFTQDQGATATPPLVALPERYRYILPSLAPVAVATCDVVPLASAQTAS